jgi:hypothetical protein
MHKQLYSRTMKNTRPCTACRGRFSFTAWTRQRYTPWKQRVAYTGTEQYTHLLEKSNGESTPEASLAAHPSAALPCAVSCTPTSFAVASAARCRCRVLDGDARATPTLPPLLPRCLGSLREKRAPSPAVKNRRGRTELRSWRWCDMTSPALRLCDGRLVDREGIEWYRRCQLRMCSVTSDKRGPWPGPEQENDVSSRGYAGVEIATSSLYIFFNQYTIYIYGLIGSMPL